MTHTTKYVGYLEAWRDVISQRCCSGTRVQLRATSTMAATSSRP